MNELTAQRGTFCHNEYWYDYEYQPPKNVKDMINT